MSARLQISFRNIQPTEQIRGWVRSEAAKLDRFYGRLQGCRVSLEMRHAGRPAGAMYRVRVDLAVPGGVIVIGRTPTLRSRVRRLGELAMQKSRELRPGGRNLRTAIQDAFKTAGRRLQDYARKRRSSPPLKLGAAVTLRTRTAHRAG